MIDKYSLSRVRKRTVRLIASANHKPPVLEALVSSFGARSNLELLEAVTNGRLNPLLVRSVTMPSVDTTNYGKTYVNAAFAYPRPKGNRFNPSTWGAWYSAFTAETALEEVKFHLTRALRHAGGTYDNETRYVELLATFDADFLDLRNMDPTPPCLHDDENPGYIEGQRIAEALRIAGGNGIVYPSVRHRVGTCLVAFWPNLVMDFQQGGVWELKWAGTPDPEVKKLA